VAPTGNPAVSSLIRALTALFAVRLRMNPTGGTAMTIESINPATGERLKTYAEMPRAAVDDIIGKTHDAFLAWQRASFEERARASSKR
jgi:acyl-CoA reductase-like NAD-dependent aldehyde dehydrogenase